MEKENMKKRKAGTILVTGAAGFIGAKVSEFLLRRGNRVVGLDNLNDYYDIRLKKHRLSALKRFPNFIFHRGDIEERGFLERVFGRYDFRAVMNLAARAGVHYSLRNPRVYMTTNALGTLNLLDLCRDFSVRKFVLASTSSLYAGQAMPFKENLPVNTPVSPYAASKKAAEAMSYSYHYLYGIDVTILRYFTVYGPAGRPDMSLFRFIRWIDQGVPIELFGDGSQSRDFTYVDDIARGTILALKKTGFKIINLGGHEPHRLSEAIGLIEKFLGKKATAKKFPFHKADLRATWADITQARKNLGWKPTVSLEEGIARTVDWYKRNARWVRNIRL
jgi:nucleoside-diphosphate-sugar epimerase